NYISAAICDGLGAGSVPAPLFSRGFTRQPLENVKSPTREMTAKLYIRLFAATLGALAASYASAATVSGNVFEDVNYGGGAGRPSSASGTASLSNVRVELYLANAFVASTTTNGSGAYSFNVGTVVGTYVVRVVNGTVLSTRTGGATCTTCVAVQTYRTNASGN